jgi:hypothetical protein
MKSCNYYNNKNNNNHNIDNTYEGLEINTPKYKFLGRIVKNINIFKKRLKKKNNIDRFLRKT